MDNKKIDRIPKGARSISSKTLDAVINGVNRLNKVYDNPQTSKISEDDGTMRLTMGADTKGGFPFEVFEQSYDTISVNRGSWVRNQTSVRLSDKGSGTIDEDNTDVVFINIDEFATEGTPTLTEDIPYYVYVQLASNVSGSTFDFDESIIPGELEVFVDSDINTAHVRDTGYLFKTYEEGGTVEARDFWIKDREVIGIIELDTDEEENYWIKSIEQKINENIIDNQIVPDSLSKDNDYDNYLRKTMSLNPVADSDTTHGTSHFGELQLYNVDTCPGITSCSLPYFFSMETHNNQRGPSGKLFWAAIDKHYVPNTIDEITHETISIFIDQNTTHVPDTNVVWDGEFDGNNFKVMGLHNATKTFASSYNVPYLLTTIVDGGNQMQGELSWAAIDSQQRTDARGSPYWYRSLDVVANGANALGDANILEIANFKAGTQVTPMAENDLIMVRQLVGTDGGPEVKYATVETIGDWLENYYSGGWDCDDVNNCIDDRGCDWIWDCITDDERFVHKALQDIAGGGYLDHDHGNYWQNKDSVAGEYGAPASDFSVNNGTSIGDTTPVLSIHLVDRKLCPVGGGYTVDWANRLLDGDDWSVNAGTILKVLDTTEGASGTGALVVTGGASIAKKVNTNDSYLVLGTKVVGAQGAAITAPSSVSGTSTSNGYGFATSSEFVQAITNIATIKTAVDQLNSRLQAHGLIL